MPIWHFLWYMIKMRTKLKRGTEQTNKCLYSSYFNLSTFCIFQILANRILWLYKQIHIKNKKIQRDRETKWITFFIFMYHLYLYTLNIKINYFIEFFKIMIFIKIIITVSYFTFYSYNCALFYYLFYTLLYKKFTWEYKTSPLPGRVIWYIFKGTVFAVK